MCVCAIGLSISGEDGCTTLSAKKVGTKRLKFWPVAKSTD